MEAPDARTRLEQRREDRWVAAGGRSSAYWYFSLAEWPVVCPACLGGWDYDEEGVWGPNFGRAAIICEQVAHPSGEAGSYHCPRCRLSIPNRLLVYPFFGADPHDPWRVRMLMHPQ